MDMVSLNWEHMPEYSEWYKYISPYKTHYNGKHWQYWVLGITSFDA